MFVLRLTDSIVSKGAFNKVNKKLGSLHRNACATNGDRLDSNNLHTSSIPAKITYTSKDKIKRGRETERQTHRDRKTQTEIERHERHRCSERQRDIEAHGDRDRDT